MDASGAETPRFGGQEFLDLRAIELVARTATQIEMHIKECDQRSREKHEARRLLAKSVARIHERLDAMLGKWLRLSWAGIGGLLLLIGYLLTQGVPWHRL